MSRHRRRRHTRRIEHAQGGARARLVAGTGISLGAAFALAAPAQAAVFEVDNTGDDGSAPQRVCSPAPNDCSLHGALLESNAITTITDTVTFASSLSGSTISLAGQKNIYDGVTIQGPGANALAITGNDTVRIFNLNPPVAGEAVDISGLTLRNGKVAGANDGGALVNVDAALVLADSVVTGSEASDGGGLSLGPEESVITGSTISGNVANQGDGGVDSDGTVYVINSTISGNRSLTSVSAGGVGAPFAYIYDSTIAGNSSNVGVGGVGNYTPGLDGALINTIVADNSGPSDDLVGQFNAASSLVEDNDGVVNAIPGSTNLLGVDPQLGPLAANGGTTPTHRPAVASPVIDQGLSSGEPTDQRGLPRPFDVPSIANLSRAGAVGDDIGAVELQANEFPTAAGPPAPTPAAKKCKKKKKAKKGSAGASAKKCKKKKKKK